MDGSDGRLVCLNESNRPAWSYCSDQGNDNEAFAETKVSRAPDEEPAVGAAEGSVALLQWVIYVACHTVPNVSVWWLAPDVGVGAGNDGEACHSSRSWLWVSY